MNYKKLCVLGLGYIGLPTASTFATHGLQVVGVDVNPQVLETLRNGGLHIHEPGLRTLVEAARAGHVERLGGVGANVAQQLEGMTGKDARYVVLGHLQRGGAPTAFDRTLATRFGGKAVELVRRGVFGRMVANNPPDIVPIPLADVVGRTKTVPLDYDLLHTARAIGVSFGD